MRKPILIFALLFSLPVIAAASIADTVIIELDNNTRIIIYVDNEDELKNLENYDINAMLRDLNMTIDSADSTTRKLVIEDESGEKYVSDTTIVVNDDDSSDYYDEDEEDEIQN